jgi:hypothetical protein
MAPALLWEGTVAKKVYLDYNATTPVAPEVLDAMSSWFTERFWNAAASHPMGMVANDAVEAARRQLAGLIGAHPNEISFWQASRRVGGDLFWTIGRVLALSCAERSIDDDVVYLGSPDPESGLFRHGVEGGENGEPHCRSI